LLHPRGRRRPSRGSWLAALAGFCYGPRCAAIWRSQASDHLTPPRVPRDEAIRAPRPPTDGYGRGCPIWIRPALRALAGRRGRNELAYQKPMARFPSRALGFPAADRDDPENCWLKSRNTHNWPTAVAVDQGTSRAARPGAGSSLHSTNGKPRVGNSKLITQNSKLARGAHSSLKNSRYSSARSIATASMIRRPASTVASSGWEPIRPSG